MVNLASSEYHSRFLRYLAIYILKRSSDHHEFENWVLAFEVGIKLIDATTTTTTEADTTNCDAAETASKQLVLDFCSMLSCIYWMVIPAFLRLHTGAQFKFDLSQFNDPSFGNNCLSIKKVAAAIYYVKGHYFKNITDESANVLHSVPRSGSYPVFDQVDFHGMFYASLIRHQLTHATISTIYHHGYCR